MALKGRAQTGTGVRREFDLSKFREGMKDTRHWLSYGVVATVGDDGEVNDKDGAAVLVTPGGVAVDVVLYPAEEPVTCRYAGVMGGPDVTIYAPIHPGDEVVVGILDGELGLPPVILAVMTSRATPLPIETDGKPVFRNDRLSIFAKTVPIEIRTPAGSVRIEPDGRVNLGGPDASEQLVEGTSYRSAEDTLLTGGAISIVPPLGPVPIDLLKAFTALEGLAVGILAPLKPGFTIGKLALQAFKDAADASNGFLSDQVRTK